jgi:curved DNA-binding protein CbpA
MRSVDDPFTFLGVGPDVTPDELAVAYRKLAKAWHPDTQSTPDAGAHMAKINAAYDAAREILANPHARRDPLRAASEGPGPGPAVDPQPRARRPLAGSWLDAAMRKALGVELIRALADHEDVVFVNQTSTWASPQTRLAVTDRRLLWLQDDAVGDRVRSLRFDEIAEVDERPSWPRRKSATLRIRDRRGRRFSFADLDPVTASDLARHLNHRLAA